MARFEPSRLLVWNDSGSLPAAGRRGPPRFCSRSKAVVSQRLDWRLVASAFGRRGTTSSAAPDACSSSHAIARIRVGGSAALRFVFASDPVRGADLAGVCKVSAERVTSKRGARCPRRRPALAVRRPAWQTARSAHCRNRGGAAHSRGRPTDLRISSIAQVFGGARWTAAFPARAVVSGSEDSSLPIVVPSGYAADRDSGARIWATAQARPHGAWLRSTSQSRRQPVERPATKAGVPAWSKTRLSPNAGPARQGAKTLGCLCRVASVAPAQRPRRSPPQLDVERRSNDSS